MITLLTDFGARDSYVAEMKAVLYGGRRVEPVVVDVTHEVAPQDVLGASMVLERAVRAFGAGTIHLAVVDPGVGSGRRIVLARINRQTVLAPDNGLITWAWRRLGHEGAYELTWRPEAKVSATFHGRDVFAPAALLLAEGRGLRRLARPIDDAVLLPVEPARSASGAAVVLHVDHFGNAITNVPAEVLSEGFVDGIRIGRRRVPLVRTYSDVAEGRALALVGSSGLLEVAVRNGSAARELRLTVGRPIELVIRALPD